MPARRPIFGQPTVKAYPWLAIYDKDAYLAMLASQSSYALMDPLRRNELLDRIGALIDEELEGTVSKEYVTVLAVARRRPAESGTATHLNPVLFGLVAWSACQSSGG